MADIQPTSRRLIVLPWLIWAAVIALAIAMALYASRASAVPVFKTQGPSGLIALRLLQDACTDEKVLKHLKPAFHARLKAARLTWGGAEWSSCWVESDGVVYSIDEEGTQLQPIPRARFVDDSI